MKITKSIIFQRVLGVVFLIPMLLSTCLVSAQVEVDFKPRLSLKAPPPFKNVENYKVQGDFKMIGNKNLTLKDYDDYINNNYKSMIYVNVDDEYDTWNSSSAELVINESCHEILFAGLYWTGSAHKGDPMMQDFSSPMVFETIRKDDQGHEIGRKTFDKQKVRLRKEGNPYIDIRAENSEILYPDRMKYQNIFVGYADVTDYVRQHGVGNYFVGDMALTEDYSTVLSLFGGWGMVVVYQAPGMKWRDITVFDGYAFMKVVVNTELVEERLPISGFRTAQSGDVNVTLGVMAAEGNVATTTDFMAILNADKNDYIRLKHGSNATDNFFNSSIYNGGTKRNPMDKNNLGIDIAKFDLDNKNKQILRNNVTSTEFLYGTQHDDYSIFSLVFAVDAYFPQIQVDNNSTNPGVTNGGTVEPGAVLDFEVNVKNVGEEAVVDGKVTLELPWNAYYLGSDKDGDVVWTPPAGAPNGATKGNTLGGTLVWNINDIAKPNSPDDILHTLKYQLKVLDDIWLLKGSSCGVNLEIKGTVQGKGVISKDSFNTGIVSGLNAACGNAPIYGPFVSTININNTAQLVSKGYPYGTKFYDGIPGSAGVNEVDQATVNQAGNQGVYYAVIPGMEASCYLKLDLSELYISTKPNVSDITHCDSNAPISYASHQLSPEGASHGYELLYFTSLTTITPLNEAPVKLLPGIYEYYAAEGIRNTENSYPGERVLFKIFVSSPLTFNENIENFDVCVGDDKTVEIKPSSGATTHWEYLDKQSGNYVTLDSSVFNGLIMINDTKLTIRKATKEIDGLKVRAVITSTIADCTAVSNEVEIKVKGCGMPVNPSIRLKMSNK